MRGASFSTGAGLGKATFVGTLAFEMGAGPTRKTPTKKESAKALEGLKNIVVRIALFRRHVEKPALGTSPSARQDSDDLSVPWHKKTARIGVIRVLRESGS